MLLVDPAAPESCEAVFEWFRFANAFERIVFYGFKKSLDSFGCCRILRLPVFAVLFSFV